MVSLVTYPAGGWSDLAPPDLALLRRGLCRAFQLTPAQVAEIRSNGIEIEPCDEGVVPDGSVLVLGSRSGNLGRLVGIVDRLLGPGGCPWDQAQTHESLKRYLLEEAYEVLDAIDSGDSERLKEELGDLLLQPILHAQMRGAAGGWNSDAVAEAICQKLVRRHPHVFGDVNVADADEVLQNWDRIKSEEKGGAPQSRLAGVPVGMASLLRAYEISKRAARAGFEWPDRDAVFAKLKEEEDELREAIMGGKIAEIESEIGDLLFTAVNIARWCEVEPEDALRRMLNRFAERFAHMEQAAAGPLEALSPEQWDDLWERSKAASAKNP